MRAYCSRAKIDNVPPHQSPPELGGSLTHFEKVQYTVNSVVFHATEKPTTLLMVTTLLTMATTLLTDGRMKIPILIHKQDWLKPSNFSWII